MGSLFSPYMKTVRPLLAATLIALCSFARADVPRTIAFQGTLKDAAGTPLTGPRQVTFSLYDAATGGTDQPEGGSVTLGS